MLHAYVHNSKLKNAAIRMVFQYWVTINLLNNNYCVITTPIEVDLQSAIDEFARRHPRRLQMCDIMSD